MADDSVSFNVPIQWQDHRGVRNKEKEGRKEGRKGVCVCVCVRETDRQTETRDREKQGL